MNPEQARSRVAETFSHAFNRAKFLEFTRNLLNKFDETKAAQWNANYVKDAFKPHIARFERLGSYTSPNEDKLDVLIVHLTNESKLERARTAIRNFVADHLKTRDEKDAALVAFVSPTESQWRFSYVKMDYAAVETESGKVGVETRLTPARRFSYIVGEGESCHTAQTRFLDLLKDTENFPTLAQLEDAFSVEAVTKEFFNQYAGLFSEIDAALQKLATKYSAIGKEFKAKNVGTVDFAKKLLGQIVFLYFLQKKGWLGVAKGQEWGTGPHDFLRRLARRDHGAYENFFNDVLEPLFYDTLATDRGHEAWCKIFKCRIPFLNGGLFEPLGDYDWRKIDIVLQNKLFTNTERNDAGDIGTGVLDVFDRYNFTVNEAEPLEKEVAIDPEMLGKVFENLIEENRRKGLGSYYTPREIVHYMCKESLINYLDTAINYCIETTPSEKRKQAGFRDENAEQTLLTAPTRREFVSRADLETFVHLGDQISHYEAVETRYAIKMPKSIEQHARLIDERLADIAVCDPAVGSGAFPVGMMTEIVRARSALTPYFNDVHDRTPYHFKRHAIQTCLYGVDIDPGAVEIAKLRLWLSLVVDEEDVKQIKPLPNLDFKIVTGNSLISFPFKSQRLNAIEKLKLRFFEETDHARKAALKQEVDRELAACFASSKKSLGYEVNFDFEIYFSEVFNQNGGFDIVFGNPPYISAVQHAASGDLLRPIYRKKYPLLKGAFDIYAVFLLRGVELTSKCGAYSWIIPNKFLASDYAKRIFSYLKQNGLKTVVDVSKYDVFEGTGVYPIIVVGDKMATNYCEYEITEVSDLGSNRLTKRTQVKQHSTMKECGILISSGTTGFQAKEFAKYISETKTPNSIPFVVSGSVDPYFVDFANVRYMGQTYRRAFIKKGPTIAESKWDFWCADKIVVAGMTKVIEATYVEQPLALGVGVYAIHGYGGLNPKYILALLNSTYLSYYMNIRFKDKHLAGGYLAINKSTIEELPMINISTAEQKPFVERVERILAAKQRDAEADVRALELEIDQLVYAVYSLTPEEIRIVEGAVK